MAHDDDSLDELASAYLDGEVTPDERARVEADPELLARVGRMREVRVVLASDVERLDRSGFDDMLRRVLAESDDEPIAAAAAAAVTTLDAARRRRATRMWKPLAAVAGAAAIGVAAISGVANMSADDSDQSSTATEIPFAAPADSTTEEGEAERDAGAGSAADGDSPETIAEITGGADVEEGSPLAADAGATQLAPAPEAAETTAAAEAASDETSAPSTTATTEQTSLTTEDELVALATDARAQLAAGMSPAPATSPCPDLGQRWDAVVWRGMPADLYLDDASGATDVDIAIVATADCTVLVRVTLP